MIETTIRQEIIKAFGWLDAPPDVLDTVTDAPRKKLSRAATETGANRDLIYVLDCWADESLPDRLSSTDALPHRRRRLSLPESAHAPIEPRPDPGQPDRTS